MHIPLALLYQFYKSYLAANAVITMIALYAIFLGSIAAIGNSIFIKVIGYGAIVIAQNYFSANTFYYYQNAGYSVRKLYIVSFSIDLIAYILLLIILSVVSYLL